ncbi:Zinc finger, PHD-type [Corchorus olitorius]|uniref:Zinc finger, PHD-type n=1 Tax=Corchorus olitorius TaxID=93759 RepID=A0A1R3KAY6_9ROSI|nr:Zinc finger, PHD-type [Corchorus olitorius]
MLPPPSRPQPRPMDPRLQTESVIGGVSSADKITLGDIARERVDVISEKMHRLPDEYLDHLKIQLRAILESQNRDEFMILHNFVQTRSDLTAQTLIKAHRTQLEILVAINMGIQAFLHPTISLSRDCLIEIFVYKRCRNIACQSLLHCTCQICANRSGFCNLCTCVICNKFDFQVNTCRWIGCDLCSHWTHTDCAIRDGQIFPSTEMLYFRCGACNGTSGLLGWVKDVFQYSAPAWDRDALIRELGFVTRVFRASDDPRGKKLFQLVEKIKGGLADCRLILMFFQELDSPSSSSSLGNGGQLLMAPQEACDRVAEVAQEVLRKLEMVGDEKMRMLKNARLSLDACEREVQDKAKQLEELKLERQKQLQELERIVRLKQKEVDIFQLKADAAKRQAERLQRFALAKSADQSQQHYATTYNSFE